VRETLSGHVRNVQIPAITPDGRTAVTVAHDATIIVWDLDGSRRVGRPFTWGSPPDQLAGVTISDLSDDGRTLAIATGRTIALWDTSPLRKKGSITAVEPVLRVAVSPDGQRLAATLQGVAPPGYVTGGSVVLYDVGTGRLRATRRVPFAWALDFDPAGELIAAGQENGGVSFLDATTLEPSGIPITQPERPYTDGEYRHTDLRFSPDGRLLAIPYIQAEEVAVWEVATRAPLARLSVPAWQAAFTPDGSLLVTGGTEGTPSFWDTRTWELVAKPVQGHASHLVGMSISSDGQTLATAGSGDEDVLLWDVASRRQIGSALPGNGPGLAVAFLPDGRRAMALSLAGRGMVWDVDPESWKRRACSVANRNLTSSEWHDFVGDRPYRATCPQFPLSDR
jgi:WD40 repeat protein